MNRYWHEMEEKYDIGESPDGYQGVVCTVPIEKKELILQLMYFVIIQKQSIVTLMQKYYVL